MRKLLAFAFLLALIDLSLAKEAIKNMAPKQRETGKRGRGREIKKLAKY